MNINRRPWPSAALWLLCCCTSPIILAQTDSGEELLASDIAFPGSQSLRSEQSDGIETYEFILSPVQSAARKLQIDESLRLPARLRRETWELPGNATFEEIRDHLREALRAYGFVTLFECQGRDCGRSSLWANQVWELSLLYGPDTSQFYLAMHNQELGLLASLYLVQRGNRRIYANLDLITPVEMPRFETSSRMSTQLREAGWVRLSGVLPSTSWLRGLRTDISDEAREALTLVAEQLRSFQGETLYVVCHLYGSGSSQELIEASTRWAGLVARQLDAEGGPKLVPFGVGPLSPRPGQAGGNRIELVLGNR